jgi:hypothetical protein
MHDFSSTHTSQEEGVRAATTMLINVRCCTGTYRTNLAMVSSNAYQWKECKNANVAMYALQFIYFIILTLKSYTTSYENSILQSK